MTMITPSYLGETIEYSSLHACRSTLEDPTKALLGLLQQNVAGYEGAFGEIKLDPRMGSQGPVH